MKKNSDKSHSSIGMFPHRFGCFLPSVTHLASEKSILPNFSMLRGVAILDCDSHSQAGSTSLGGPRWAFGGLVISSLEENDAGAQKWSQRPGTKLNHLI